MTRMTKTDEEKISLTKTVAKIREEAKKDFLPSLQNKMTDTVNYVTNLFEEKGVEKVNNIQLTSIIAKNSLTSIACGGGQSYTSQELLAGFNLYVEMIQKINEYKTFPPTIETFCNFIGISTITFNSWETDADRREAIQYIKSYLTGTLATGSLTGDLKEISSIYIQKTMGKVEQATPVVIEHKKEADIDDIRRRIEEAKRNNKITEANYEEI